MFRLRRPLLWCLPSYAHSADLFSLKLLAPITIEDHSLLLSRPTLYCMPAFCSFRQANHIRVYLHKISHSSFAFLQEYHPKSSASSSFEALLNDNIRLSTKTANISFVICCPINCAIWHANKLNKRTLYSRVVLC